MAVWFGECGTSGFAECRSESWALFVGGVVLTVEFGDCLLGVLEVLEGFPGVRFSAPAGPSDKIVDTTVNCGLADDGGYLEFVIRGIVL